MSIDLSFTSIMMTDEGKEQRVREIMAVLAGLSHEDKIVLLREAVARARPSAKR